MSDLERFHLITLGIHFIRGFTEKALNPTQSVTFCSSQKPTLGEAENAGPGDYEVIEDAHIDQC